MLIYNDYKQEHCKKVQLDKTVERILRKELLIEQAFTRENMILYVDSSDYIS